VICRRFLLFFAALVAGKAIVFRIRERFIRVTPAT
jgi:hypothetical protein